MLNYFKENKVPSVYESIYTMGNTYKLNDEECEDIAVAKNIITVMNLVKEEDVEAEAPDFVSKFYRSGGLIERLKTYLNLDLELFDKNNKRIKCEKCKILYFFYMLEKKNFPASNILMQLSKHSMENIDNSPLKWDTYNGVVTKFIKDSLENEMSPQAVENIKNAISYISSSWDAFLDKALIKMDSSLSVTCEYEFKVDFEETIRSLEPMPHELFVDMKDKEYELSPIETLYLRMLQYESLGQIRDIKKINSILADADYKVPSEMIGEMKCLSKRNVEISRVTEYIQINSMEIAKYVYLKNNTNKEERRRIRDSKEKVVILIDFCIRARPLIKMENEITELFIISCLQAILTDGKNEIFDYIFHGYQNYIKQRPHVQGALKTDRPPVDALKVYWVRKIIDHWYANIGRYDSRCNLRKLENVCDNILEQIFSCTNISDMLKMHSLYSNRLG